MPQEIERKFLVKPELWRAILPERSFRIRQGYLADDTQKTIRVRVAGDKGFITVKSRMKENTFTRDEFEYEIPCSDANYLLEQFTTGRIEKVRHIVRHEGKTWEVDEFTGDNEGLTVAEIELHSEEETFSAPPWLDAEVTHDKRYANSNLVKRPFKSW